MRDTDIFLGVARTKLAQMLPGIQGAGAPTSDPSASPSGVANAAASPGAMAGQSAAPTTVGAPKVPKVPKAPLLNANSRTFPVLNSTTRKTLSTPTGQQGPAKLASLALAHYTEVEKRASLVAPHPQPPTPTQPYGAAPTPGPQNAAAAAKGKKEAPQPPGKKAIPGAVDQSMIKKDPGAGLARMPSAGGPGTSGPSAIGMVKKAVSDMATRGERAPPTPRKPLINWASASPSRYPRTFAATQVAQDLTGFPTNSAVFSPKGRAATEHATNTQDRQAFVNSRAASRLSMSPINWGAKARAYSSDPRAYIAAGVPASAALMAPGGVIDAGAHLGARAANRVVGATAFGKGMQGAGASLGAGRVGGQVIKAAPHGAHGGKGLIAEGANAVASGLARYAPAAVAKHAPRVAAAGAEVGSHMGAPVGHLAGHMGQHEVAVVAANKAAKAVSPSGQTPAPAPMNAVASRQPGSLGALASNTGSFVSGATGGVPSSFAESGPKLRTPKLQSTPRPKSTSGGAPAPSMTPAAPKPSQMSMAAPFMSKTSSAAWSNMLAGKLKYAQTKDLFTTNGGRTDPRGYRDYSNVPAGSLRAVGGSQVPDWYRNKRIAEQTASTTGVRGFVNRGIAGTGAAAGKVLNYRLPGGETPGKLIGDGLMATTGLPSSVPAGAARYMASRGAGAAKPALNAAQRAVTPAVTSVRRGIDAAGARLFPNAANAALPQTATAGARTAAAPVAAPATKTPVGSQWAAAKSGKHSGNATAPAPAQATAAPNLLDKATTAVSNGVKQVRDLSVPKPLDKQLGDFAAQFSSKEPVLRPQGVRANFSQARTTPYGTPLPSWVPGGKDVAGAAPSVGKRGLANLARRAGGAVNYTRPDMGVMGAAWQTGKQLALKPAAAISGTGAAIGAAGAAAFGDKRVPVLDRAARGAATGSGVNAVTRAVSKNGVLGGVAPAVGNMGSGVGRFFMGDAPTPAAAPRVGAVPQSARKPTNTNNVNWYPPAP